MKATFRVLNEGNLAIQEEAFTVPTSAAKFVISEMKKRGAINPGSYWLRVFATPARRAIRAKSDTVKIYTAGFSTCELANWLRGSGCEVEREN